MKATVIKCAILGLALIGSAGLAVMHRSPAVHADVAVASSATITATNGLFSPTVSTPYTYFYVGGHNFTPGGWVTITVADSATGAVLDTVRQQASVAHSVAGTSFSAGWIGAGFHYSAPCSVTQVTIQAVDSMTGQVSNSVAMAPKSAAC